MQQTPADTAGEYALPAERSGDRFGIALPITMDDVEGETLDISETGILFEIAADSQPEVGARVRLTLDYSMDGRAFRTRCEAEVVRVERVGGKVNVATRLLSPLHAGQ